VRRRETVPVRDRIWTCLFRSSKAWEAPEVDDEEEAREKSVRG
jgi:hypothetical protein